jgi:hypothetical protein
MKLLTKRLQELAKKALPNEAACIGKTVKHFDAGYDSMSLVFTDGTWIAFKVESHAYGEHTLDWTDNPLHIGDKETVTQKDRQVEQDARMAERRKEQEEEHRQLYESLKKRFGD